MRISDFDLYKDLLKEKSGLTLTPDKSYLLDSRLTPVARKWNYANLEIMTMALRAMPPSDLVKDVVEAMTTNETSFFRDTKPFDQFRDVIMPHMMKNRPKKLRNPTPQQVAELTATYPLVRGVLPATWTLYVDGRSKNLAQSISRGIDFDLRTRLSHAQWGDWLLGLNGTWFTRHDVAATANSPFVSQLNTIYNPIRLRTRASAQWRLANLTAAAVVNHTSAYKNNLTAPTQNVRSQTTLDLRLSYALDELFRGDALRDTVVSLGITNVFDRDPPFVNLAPSPNGGGGFDPSLASPLGRVIALSVSKRF